MQRTVRLEQSIDQRLNCQGFIDIKGTPAATDKTGQGVTDACGALISGGRADDG